jgi:hypothetical protein
MDRQIKYITLLIAFLLTNIPSYSCDCDCIDDCSFHKVVKNSKLVALVKVISHDNYLSADIMGYNGKMPQSMTVEIIKLYRGTETRKRIKIWGDNGALCRPYIANFPIGDYFLIAPDLIEKPFSTNESKTDYEFFSCFTDYLRLDMKTKIAYGQYKKQQDRITLDIFEKTMKK